MTRRYERDNRDHTREHKESHEYTPRETEYVERGPKDQTFRRPARVRAFLKRKFNDPWKNFKELLQDFRRRVSNAGIMHDLKDHQYYESKTEKKRKKKRESQKRLLMESLTKKVLAGERVEGHGGLVKKVQSNIKKEKEKKDKRKERNNGRQYEDRQYED
jgi:ribosomal protein S21